MKNRNNHRKSFKRYRYIAVVILAAALVGGGFWLRHNHQQETKVGTTSSGSYVNLSPPTEKDLQNNDANKKALSDSQNNSTNSTPSKPGKTQVTPIITSASQTEVRAFVQGIIEDDGTCSATLTQGSSSITKTSSGFSNVSYTTCQPIELSGALGSGKWTLAVSYSSTTSEGTSTSQVIEVK